MTTRYSSCYKQCLPQLKNFEGKVLILSGDVPLIKKETLKEFLKHMILIKKHMHL